MGYRQQIDEAFQKALGEFRSSTGMSRFLAGETQVAHYKSLLREIFHHTRENPQLQALATVYFRGSQRAAVKGFLRHALSEVGHDQLALDDLRTLGEPVEEIPLENPLPATTALLSFGFYQIYNLDPVGYLGYLYFLEFTPTQAGREFMTGIERMGVPREAMTFLQDHATIDIGHNRMMESYVDELVTSERHRDAVIYAMQVTGELYGNFVTSAFRRADGGPGYGRSSIEA
jgi:hypothetical protein